MAREQQAEFCRHEGNVSSGRGRPDAFKPQPARPDALKRELRDAAQSSRRGTAAPQRRHRAGRPRAQMRTQARAHTVKCRPSLRLFHPRKQQRRVVEVLAARRFRVERRRRRRRRRGRVIPAHAFRQPRRHFIRRHLAIPERDITVLTPPSPAYSVPRKLRYASVHAMFEIMHVNTKIEPHAAAHRAPAHAHHAHERQMSRIFH